MSDTGPIAVSMLRPFVYVIDCCTPISDVASPRHLRSASRRQVLVPRHSLSTYGRRVFSVAGPAA